MGCKHSKQLEETATPDYGGAPNDVDNEFDDFSSFKRVRQLLCAMDKLNPADACQDVAIQRVVPYIAAEMGITGRTLPAPVVMALAREGCRRGCDFRVERAGDGDRCNYVVVPVGERGECTDV